jgi:hypothetical protein
VVDFNFLWIHLLPLIFPTGHASIQRRTVIRLAGDTL